MLQCLPIFLFGFLVVKNVIIQCTSVNYRNELYNLDLEPSKFPDVKLNNANKFNTNDNIKGLFLNYLRKLTNQCNYAEVPKDCTKHNKTRKIRRYFTGLAGVYQNIPKQEKLLQGSNNIEMAKLMVSGLASNLSSKKIPAHFNISIAENSMTSPTVTQHFWRKFKRTMCGQRDRWTTITNSVVKDVSISEHKFCFKNGIHLSTVQLKGNQFLDNVNQSFSNERESTECDRKVKIGVSEIVTNACHVYQNNDTQQDKRLINCTQQIVLTSPVCNIISYLEEDEKSAQAIEIQREQKLKHKRKTTVVEKSLICPDLDEMIADDEDGRGRSLIIVRKKSLPDTDCNDPIQYSALPETKNISVSETDDITSQLLQAHKGLEIKHKDQNKDSLKSNEVEIKNHGVTLLNYYEYSNELMNKEQNSQLINNTLLKENKMNILSKINKNNTINVKPIIATQIHQSLGKNSDNENKIISKSVSKGLFYDDCVNYPWSKKRKKLLLEIQNNLSSLQALKTETKELKEQFKYLKDELLKPLLSKNQTSKFNFHHFDERKLYDDTNYLHNLCELNSTNVVDRSTEKLFIKELNVILNEPGTTENYPEIHILQESAAASTERTDRFFVKEEKFKELLSGSKNTNKSGDNGGTIQVLTISEVVSDQKKNKGKSNNHFTTCEVIYKIIENSMKPIIENDGIDASIKHPQNMTDLAEVAVPDTFHFEIPMKYNKIAGSTLSEGLERFINYQGHRLILKPVTKVDKTADSDRPDDTIGAAKGTTQTTKTGTVYTICETIHHKKENFGECEELPMELSTEPDTYRSSGKTTLSVNLIPEKSSGTENSADTSSLSTGTSLLTDFSSSTDTSLITDASLSSETSSAQIKSSFTATKSETSKTMNADTDKFDEILECTKITCPTEKKLVESKVNKTEATTVNLECTRITCPAEELVESIGNNTECGEIDQKTNKKTELLTDEVTSESPERSPTTVNIKTKITKIKTTTDEIIESTINQEETETTISDSSEANEIGATPKPKCKVIPVIFSVKTLILTNVSAQVEECNPSAKIRILNVNDSANTSMNSPLESDFMEGKPIKKVILSKEAKGRNIHKCNLISGKKNKDDRFFNILIKNPVNNYTHRNRIPISLVTDIESEPQNNNAIININSKFFSNNEMINKTHAVNRKSTKNNSGNTIISHKPLNKFQNVFNFSKSTVKNLTPEVESSNIKLCKNKQNGITKSIAKVTNQHFKTTLKSIKSNFNGDSFSDFIKTDDFKNTLTKNISNFLKNKNLINIDNILEPLIKIPVSYFGIVNNTHDDNLEKINIDTKQNGSANFEMTNILNTEEKKFKTENLKRVENKKNVNFKDIKNCKLKCPMDVALKPNCDIDHEKNYNLRVKDNAFKKYKNNFTVQISFIEKPQSDFQNFSPKSGNLLFRNKDIIDNNILSFRKLIPANDNMGNLPENFTNSEGYGSNQNNNKNNGSSEISSGRKLNNNLKSIYHTIFSFQNQENHGQNQNHNDNKNLYSHNCTKLNNYRHLNNACDLNILSNEFSDGIEGIDQFYISSGSKPKENQKKKQEKEIASKNENELQMDSVTVNYLQNGKDDPVSYSILITKTINNQVELENLTNKIQIFQSIKTNNTNSTNDIVSYDIRHNGATDAKVSNSKFIKTNSKDDKKRIKTAKNKNLVVKSRKPEPINEFLFGSNNKNIQNKSRHGSYLETTINLHITVPISSHNYTLLPNNDNYDRNNVINYLNKDLNINKFTIVKPSHDNELNRPSTKSFLELIKLKNYHKKTKALNMPTDYQFNRYELDRNMYSVNGNSNKDFSHYSNKIQQYLELSRPLIIPNQMGLDNSTLLNDKIVETNKFSQVESENSKNNINNKIKVNFMNENSNKNHINYVNKISNINSDIPFQKSHATYQEMLIKKLMEKNNLQMMNSNVNLLNRQNTIQLDSKFINENNFKTKFNNNNAKNSDVHNYQGNCIITPTNLTNGNFNIDLIKVINKPEVFTNAAPRSKLYLDEIIVQTKSEINEQKNPDKNLHNNVQIHPNKYLSCFTRRPINKGKGNYFIGNNENLNRCKD